MNYQAIKNKAYLMLKKYGSECSLHIQTEKTYNAETNCYEGEEEIVNGVAIINSYDSRHINEEIKAGDVKILCVIEKKPKVDDVIFIGDTFYTVINVSEVKPNGIEVVYYEVQGR